MAVVASEQRMRSHAGAGDGVDLREVMQSWEEVQGNDTQWNKFMCGRVGPKKVEVVLQGFHNSFCGHARWTGNRGTLQHGLFDATWQQKFSQAIVVIAR